MIIFNFLYLDDNKIMGCVSVFELCDEGIPWRIKNIRGHGVPLSRIKDIIWMDPIKFCESKVDKDI